MFEINRSHILWTLFIYSYIMLFMAMQIQSVVQIHCRRITYMCVKCPWQDFTELGYINIYHVNVLQKNKSSRSP
jgi:hypothetical protein